MIDHLNMKITDINPTFFQNRPLEDSELHFKGHGKLESASESSSILHVISHELGHVAEFKAQAIRDKTEIRSIDMKIQFEFRDGRLVAVGGNTKMTSVEKNPIPDEIGKQMDLFPTNSSIPPKEILPSMEKITEEAILQEKLNLIQNELKSILNKAYYRDIYNREVEDDKDFRKQANYREIRNRLQKELDELRRRVDAEKSKELLLKVAEMQNNLKTGFINPEDINVLVSSEKHLDLIA